MGDELNALMEDLLQKSSVELSGIYQQNGDSRVKRFENLAQYQASWVGEIEKDLDTLRHSKCAEITLLFAHHLSELHYKAKAHGAYPFWWGGGSDSADSDIEVWW